MAQFEVTFYEYTRPLKYEDYSMKTTYPCTEEPSVYRYPIFNDVINGDFVIGYNYSGGIPATLRIHSFGDSMTHTEVSTGTVWIPSGFTPDKLMDEATGLELTYPYDKDINNITDIHTFNEATSPYVYEFYCSGTTKTLALRVRKIVYSIIDEYGLEGPKREAMFIINEQ